MKNRQYNVLGIMSGTSCDGIDLAHCRFTFSQDNQWEFAINESETIPYDRRWQKRLSTAINLHQRDIESFNLSYTALLNKVILEFIDRTEITELDLICSHGHTVWHKPEQGLTFQIGNLSLIAQNMPCPVVCDFRIQDVALGGQGAPLVPIGDQLLFNDFDACINLGGFANISYSTKEGSMIAYDLCPFNIVLNYWAQKLGENFDKNGRFASSGVVHEALLSELNSLAYYTQKPPKSLGLEWVQSHIYPLYQKYKLRPQDWLATAGTHMVTQVHQGAKNFDRILITGGGAYNGFILDRLTEVGPGKFTLPEPQLIDYKEALVFGLLGVLRYRDEVNTLASVTGASRNHSAGVIWMPY